MRLKLDDLPAAAATGRGSESARKALEKQRQAKPKPPSEAPPAENKAPAPQPPKGWKR
jgi:hypothetical protein